MYKYYTNTKIRRFMHYQKFYDFIIAGGITSHINIIREPR